MDLLGYFASFLMGVTLGLMGGGGSILTVPILVYLFRIAPSAATGYSLFVVGLTALAGSLIYLKKGNVSFQTAFLFGVPSIFGVNFARSVLVPALPEVFVIRDSWILTKDALIMIVFAMLMVTASYSMLRRKGKKERTQLNPVTRLSLIVGEGVMVGVIAGFVGAGGGFLIIPALVVVAGLPMLMAVGTSLTIIALQSLSGFAGDVLRGASVDWSLLLVITASAGGGIALGSALAPKIKEQSLRTAFGWFVLVMGTLILLEQLR
jgi:uncharacterized membrane protein YfcA